MFTLYHSLVDVCNLHLSSQLRFSLGSQRDSGPVNSVGLVNVMSTLGCTECSVCYYMSTGLGEAGAQSQVLGFIIGFNTWSSDGGTVLRGCDTQAAVGSHRPLVGSGLKVIFYLYFLVCSFCFLIFPDVPATFLRVMDQNNGSK